MQQLDHTRIPQHIAIIMDGNGRWAKAKGLPRTAGHVEGVEAVRRITEECTRLGVKFLTLYTFSTENWNRPQEEVSALMGLVLSSLEEEIFQRNNVRFRVIGDRYRLPREVLAKLEQVERNTRDNDAMTMVVALSYSARWEIAEACRRIWVDMQGPLGEGRCEWDIDERLVDSYMQTSFMPDPDLLIRTGGEQRISNFLLWQLAYTELYFCDTFWPDFRAEDLHRAIADFQRRQRRYGKTGDQITAEATTPEAPPSAAPVAPVAPVPAASPSTPEAAVPAGSPAGPCPDPSTPEAAVPAGSPAGPAPLPQ